MAYEIDRAGVEFGWIVHNSFRCETSWQGDLARESGTRGNGFLQQTAWNWGTTGLHRWVRQFGLGNRR